MKNNDVKFTLPMLEAPRTMRILFRKVGNLQYISHLDLQRTFSRVLVRAGLPLWYTKGFNPHIKMIFGLPLPVGAESECELLDIRIEREMSNEEICRRLNDELTEELAVKEVYPPEHKFTDIAYAAYEFRFITADPDLAKERIATCLAKGPLTAIRKTKSTEKEIDVREFIKRYDLRREGEAIVLDAVLDAAEGRVLSPEVLVSALRTHAGILSGDPMAERYRVLRRRLFLSDAETEFR